MKKLVLVLLACAMAVGLAVVTGPARAEAASETYYVTADYVRERAGASLDAEIICKHMRGDEVEVVRQEGDWCLLTNGDYIFAQYLIPKSQAPLFFNQPTYFFKADYVRERSGPSTDYEIVTTHRLGEGVKIIGQTGDWYQIENGNYVYAEYLVPDLETVLAQFEADYDDLIEISITKQYVRYVKAGEVITEGDCVTGDVYSSPTPTGLYRVYYKNHDFDMCGNPDTHVRYFTCFNGGIGCHDADWRHGEFGGDIYKGNGSHGCINMAEGTAAAIYQHSSIGTYVIVLP